MDRHGVETRADFPEPIAPSAITASNAGRILLLYEALAAATLILPSTKDPIQ